MFILTFGKLPVMVLRLSRILLFVLCLPAAHQLSAQEMNAEERAAFVAEQDAYLEKLQLSIDQRRSYQQITIQYEKLLQNLDRSQLSESGRKKQRKKILAAKDSDMKQLLSPWQYKTYLKRQKEIEKHYL